IPIAFTCLTLSIFCTQSGALAAAAKNKQARTRGKTPSASAKNAGPSTPIADAPAKTPSFNPFLARQAALGLLEKPPVTAPDPTGARSAANPTAHDPSPAWHAALVSAVEARKLEAGDLLSKMEHSEEHTSALQTRLGRAQQELDVEEA